VSIFIPDDVIQLNGKWIHRCAPEKRFDDNLAEYGFHLAGTWEKVKEKPGPPCRFRVVSGRARVGFKTSFGSLARSFKS
jgi:hypothetical protein